ncbi:MAG: polyprenyl synthetase family protein [Firmicutes bacterium]|nr:polyprenyl synthetase family protein [Bacillota bacterium]
MKLNNSEYNRLKKLVDEHILDFIPNIDPKSKTLYDSMKYSLTAGGKRLRPVLLLAAVELCRGNAAEYLSFACAAEYIQTYSLIHDDLPAMDDDDYRRGKLTNHKVYGEGIAVLAGDGLLSAAYEVMIKNMLMYLDEPEALNRRVRATYALTKGTGCRGMISGQVADLESENKECSAEMLDFIHDNKTAAFITSCAMAGGYLGGAEASMMEDLRIYGNNLGLAFQVVDDILDVIGDAEEMGKSTGKDAELGKNTYISVYGLERSKERAHELIGKAREVMEKYYDEAEVFNYVLDLLESQIV